MSLLMEALKRAERDKHKADTDESATEKSSADQAGEQDWPLTPAPLQDGDVFPSIEWTEPAPGDSAPAAMEFSAEPALILEAHTPEPTPAATTDISLLAVLEPAWIPPVDAIQAHSTHPPLQPPAQREESVPAEPSPLRAEPKSQSAAPETTTAQRQQLAANVLAATQKAPGRNRQLPVAVGVMAILLLAGSTYLYWQYPQHSSPPNPGEPRPPPAAPSIAPPAMTAAMAPVEPSPPLPTPQAPPPPMPTAVETVASDMSRADLRQIPPSPVPVAEQAPKESAITIRRGTHKDQVAPALERGYSAFMAGNDSLAQQEYTRILRQDSNNRDALLGMAAIAAKREHWDEALKTYLRLQELDPRDAAAQAGLLSLTAGQADPVQSESRVKNLLAQQPDAHFLHFALGNLYAGQSRWAEAQQAFFRAYQKAPNNPDYLYNLAISLDHLNQGKLALEYYQRALSQSGPANFDKVSARNRARELQQPAEN
jgi:tetratricopeptide (TPR) repeat protein